MTSNLNETMSITDETIAQSILSAHPAIAFGPLLIGFGAEALLAGVCIHMSIDWFVWGRPDERRFTRWLVYYLMLVNTIVTAFITAYAMNVFAYGFGKYFPIMDYRWTSWMYIFDGLIRIPVMGFFAERSVRMTSNSPFLIVVLAVLLMTALGASIACKVIVRSAFQDSYAIKLSTYLWLGSEVTADLIITGVLLITLKKSKTGWRHTDSLIGKLMTIVIETQVPPTLIAVIYLTMYCTVSAETSGLLGLTICGSKIYLLALLAVLKARQKLQNSWQGSSSSQPKMNTFGGKSRQRGAPSEIQVYTETFVSREQPEDNTNVPVPQSQMGAVEDDYELDKMRIGDAESAVDFSSSQTRLTKLPAVVIN